MNQKATRMLESTEEFNAGRERELQDVLAYILKFRGHETRQRLLASNSTSYTQAGIHDARALVLLQLRNALLAGEHRA